MVCPLSIRYRTVSSLFDITATANKIGMSFGLGLMNDIPVENFVSIAVTEEISKFVKRSSNT